MAEIIGIDLGTTNSVLAHLRGGPEVININGRPTLPSVVALDGGSFLVGSSAKNLAAVSDEVIVSPKRKMGTDHQYALGGRNYTPVNISAMILQEIKKHAEAFLGEKVDTAVITIPAYFNQQQVMDTKKAAEEAGLKVGKLLAEPVAASATYGTGGEETILVFDLGGGTLDCTVVDTFDAMILGLSGDNWLGGDDFDNRIVDRMVKHLKEESGIDISSDAKARARMKQKAEVAKINLSETSSTIVEFMGKLGGKLCQVEFRLTRDEYNKMIDDLVARAIEKADEAIKQAGMTKKDIDVVLLVGGSTMTPYVQERLAAHFGKPPSKRVDPMLAVGLGAAICTRDVPWDDKTHRVILRTRAEVWPDDIYTIKGRTTAGSAIEVVGAREPAQAKAADKGDFSCEIKLNQNAINDLVVQATSPKGEAAKAVQRIRHDASAGKEAAQEPAPPPVIQATTPRSFLIGLSEDNIAPLLKAGANLPASGESHDFFVKANNMPFTLVIPLYEGHMPDHEIPFGPFNTHMGTLNIQCPPTATSTPLVVAFEVDESRIVTFRCWFKDDPSVSGTITISPKSISRDSWHLLERVDTSLNTAGERIRPDERAKINHKRQALIDLCEQYAANESPDLRTRIIRAGEELKNEIAALEKKYSF